MILIDYSAISIAAIVANLARTKEKAMEKEYGQHLILNSVRHFIKMFDGQFGDVVICCDGMYSWRKNFFKYYKANRKKEKDSSGFDWNALFDITNSTKAALREHFPVYVIEKETQEADDLIACYALNAKEPVMICSEDKDFYQLLLHEDSAIYHNRKKEFFLSPILSNIFPLEWLKSRFRSPLYQIVQFDTEEVKEYKLKHIMKGDVGDGIPNFLSDDDCLVDPKKRQKPLTTARLDYYLREYNENGITHFNDAEKTYFNRNACLIDLSTAAHTQYPMFRDIYIKGLKTEREKSYNMLNTQNWLIQSTLVELAKNVKDFYPAEVKRYAEGYFYEQ